MNDDSEWMQAIGDASKLSRKVAQLPFHIVCNF